jgi:anti-sigma factor RsiW
MSAGGPIGEDDLQALVDGRLAGPRLTAVEAYLAGHPEIADRVARERQQRDELHSALAGKFLEPIPSRLRIANVRASRSAGMVRSFRTMAAAAAIFVLGGVVGGVAGYSLSRDGSGPAAHSVARDATAAYRTFVVEVAHPVEVNAANEAHLIRWLSKRLDRPLVVPDLARFGFSLMGGRLLPAGSAAAAQLMYEDGSGKRLTFYVQAAAAGEATAFRFRQEGDASTLAWIDGGLGCAVTAALSREQLLPIAEAVYHTLDGDGDGAPMQGERTPPA